MFSPLAISLNRRQHERFERMDNDGRRRNATHKEATKTGRSERVFIAGVSSYVGEVKLDNDFNQRGLRTKVLSPFIAFQPAWMRSGS